MFITKPYTQFGVIVTSIVFIFACQSNEPSFENVPSKEISPEVSQQIKNLGFSPVNAKKTKEGYLVEGDILLTKEILENEPSQQLLRVGNEEQYRTTNLVTALPRTITIRVTGLSSAFVQGTDLAIQRYNNLGLRIRFQRITSGTANITIRGFFEAPDPDGFITLGSAGFPTRSGSPHNSISMNTHPSAYGSNPNVSYVGSVIQHELGHCIGFRHTDYRDRSFSCGGSVANEGASSSGAILIPGTPAGPDPNSFMLACSNGGNRTFNANDVTALQFLY